MLMKFQIHTLIKNNYASLYVLRFLRFPEYFFATTYHVSGFGAGKICFHILFMLVNYSLSSQHLISKHPVFC